MTRKDLYERWLEAELRKKTKTFLLLDTKQRDIDIETLLEHIENKNPKLLKKLLLNVTHAEGMSQDELMTFLGKTQKNEIIRWTDEHGRNFYFLNRGKGVKGKNIIVLGNTINLKEFEILKKTFLRDQIRKDIERIYEKIRKEQQQKELLRRKGFSENRFKKMGKSGNLPSASDFEKEMIRELKAGNGSPKGIAKSIISVMDSSEQKKLDGLLKSKGIRSPEQFEQYLDGLKGKVLKKSFSITKDYERGL